MKKSMREKILSTTAKIIANEGLDAVSIRYVCEKVGVKAPTIYYYFKDKEGLIEAVVGLAYLRYGKKQFALAKNESPLIALKKSWDIFFEFVEEETDLFHAIVIAHLRQRIPPDSYQIFVAIVDIFRKLEEKNKLKQDAVTSTRIMSATAYGMALVYVSQGKKPELVSNISLTRDLCLQSLMS